jgi:catechol 2,3-dioxygenase-like lactoylglutathione lyase family enzyme
MAIKRMGHVAIQVEDMARAATFYKDVLGLKVEWSGDDDWANLSVGGDDLSLVKKAGAVHPEHIGFRVDTEAELVEWNQKIAAAGVRVEPIKKHRDGSVSFYFWDHDGHALEALWDPRSLGQR